MVAEPVVESSGMKIRSLGSIHNAVRLLYVYVVCPCGPGVGALCHLGHVLDEHIVEVLSTLLYTPMYNVQLRCMSIL